jgi:hypothetical protein
VRWRIRSPLRAGNPERLYQSGVNSPLVPGDRRLLSSRRSGKSPSHLQGHWRFIAGSDMGFFGGRHFEAARSGPVAQLDRATVS